MESRAVFLFFRGWGGNCWWISWTSHVTSLPYLRRWDHGSFLLNYLSYHLMQALKHINNIYLENLYLGSKPLKEWWMERKYALVIKNLPRKSRENKAFNESFVSLNSLLMLMFCLGFNLLPIIKSCWKSRQESSWAIVLIGIISCFTAIQMCCYVCVCVCQLVDSWVVVWFGPLPIVCESNGW